VTQRSSAYHELRSWNSSSPAGRRRFRFASATLLAVSLTLLFLPATPAHAIIQGSVVADPERFPFVGYLEWRTPAPNDGVSVHHCTASLIRADWALTAQHCVREDDGDLAPDVAVTLTFATTTRGGAGAWQVASDRIVRARRYVDKFPDLPVNDLALIHLREPAPWWVPLVPVAGIDQANLWDPTRTDATPRQTVVGWGLVEPDNPSLPPEQRPRVSDEQRETSHTVKSANRENVIETVPAGEGDRPPAGGDSGGPLLADDQESGFVQVGVLTGGDWTHSLWPAIGSPHRFRWIDDIVDDFDATRRWPAASSETTGGSASCEAWSSPAEFPGPHFLLPTANIVCQIIDTKADGDGVYVAWQTPNNYEAVRSLYAEQGAEVITEEGTTSGPVTVFDVRETDTNSFDEIQWRVCRDRQAPYPDNCADDWVVFDLDNATKADPPRAADNRLTGAGFEAEHDSWRSFRMLAAENNHYVYCRTAVPGHRSDCFLEFNHGSQEQASVQQDVDMRIAADSPLLASAYVRCPTGQSGCSAELAVWGDPGAGDEESRSVMCELPADGKWRKIALAVAGSDADGAAFTRERATVRWELYNRTPGTNLDVDDAFLSADAGAGYTRVQLPDAACRQR
jgi:secreted trypsin-like serine protease